jgi:hypothetical protein
VSAFFARAGDFSVDFVSSTGDSAAAVFVGMDKRFGFFHQGSNKISR